MTEQLINEIINDNNRTTHEKVLALIIRATNGHIEACSLVQRHMTNEYLKGYRDGKAYMAVTHGIKE